MKKSNLGNFVGLVFGIFVLLIGFIIKSTETGTSKSSSMIIIGISGLLIILFILRINKTKKHNKSINEAIINNVELPKLSSNVLHIYGLDGVPENIGVELLLYADHLDIKTNNETFKLSLEKLRNFDIKSDTELNQQYVSSIGGAALGAAIAGPLGLMFGGRAKKKTSRTVHHFLVVGFDTDSDKKVLLFQDDSLRIKKMVNLVNNTIKIEHRTTEL